MQTTQKTKLMLYGSSLYYQCTKCENILSTESLTSGNTFNSQLYSDGKLKAPMMPKFPAISKCTKCDTIFWLDESSRINTDEDLASEKAKFLTIDENVRALKLSENQTKAHETYLRINIWQLFNDRIRDNLPIFNLGEEKTIWENNIIRLAKIIDKENDNNKIMIAEIYRNIGKFKKSEEILEKISDTNFSRIIEQFKQEINKGNKYVFEIK